MKANVLSLSGEIKGTVELPKVFELPVRTDLIRRDVISIITKRIQPKGTRPMAGRDYTAEYVGRKSKPVVWRTRNIGRARLPRTKNRRYLIQGWVANVPQAVGGPRAHPPKPDKKIEERINKKERRLARFSAISATAVSSLVKERGHIFNADLPIIVEDKLEEIKTVKDVRRVLEAIGVWSDVERAKHKKRKRAGKGKRRGRKYKIPKSVLIVVGKNRGIYNAARNLPGVDVVEARNLNTELLAPGGLPGRLTVWTESAIRYIGEVS